MDARVVRKILWMPANRRDLMTTSDSFGENLGSNKSSSADECDFHNVSLAMLPKETLA